MIYHKLTFYILVLSMSFLPLSINANSMNWIPSTSNNYAVIIGSNEGGAGQKDLHFAEEDHFVA